MSAYNFGALPPLPDGYRVEWIESVEHFMALGPDEWESAITCDPHQARRWCFDRAEALSGAVDLIERSHL